MRQTALAPGAPAPDFELETHTGERVRLSAGQGARSLVLNATVTQPGGNGWISIFPGDAMALSLVSNVNFTTGLTRAGASVVPLTVDGTGSLNVANVSFAATHFILDVSGYFR